MNKITPRVKFVIGLLLFLGFTNLLTSENTKAKTSYSFLKITFLEDLISENFDFKDYKNESASDNVTNPSKTSSSPSASISVTVITVDSKTNISCFGGSDGSIQIIVSGDTGPYTYLWRNGTGTFNATTQNISGLEKGDYIVEVTDANFNKEESEPIAIEEPEMLLMDMPSFTNISCNGANNGSITAGSVTGGSGDYLYSIDGINYFSTGTFNNLSPGNYIITVKDSNACTATQEVSLSHPLQINAIVNSTNVTCFGANDGTILITNSEGGYGTYEYSINNGNSWQNTGNFTGLNNGNFQVLIRDKAYPSCSVNLNSNLIIIQPPLLNANVTSTNVTCNGAADGKINISNPQGGNGTYEYSINNGTSWQNTGNFTGLNNGNFQVLIRDKKNTGCTITLNPNLSITQPTVLSSTVSSTNVTCFGANDGTITITNSQGGYGIYEYSINNGTTWQDSGTFTGLIYGNYRVLIRDKDYPACTVTLNSNLIITQPIVLSAAVSSSNVSCFGGNNGSISITSPIGGYGTYQYSINNGTSWQDSGNFSGLTAANYIVMIRDKANPACSVLLKSSLTITQPNALNATVTSSNITCNGSNDGKITITNPIGGFGTYQFSVNNGTTWQDSGNFSALPNSTYKILIRDKAQPSCVVILSESFLISQPAPLEMAEPSSTMLTCFGGNTGTITAGAMSGGNGDYLYSLDNLNFQSNTTFNGLTAGVYTIFVKDKKGCAFQKQVNLNQAEKLNAGLLKTDVLCFGGNSGQIKTNNPTGGSGNYEYRIGSQAWQTGLIFDNLPAGIYSVSIRDRNIPTCIIVLPSIQINQPAAALTTAVSSTRTTVHGTSTGSASANPSGGTAPYTYEWRRKDESPVLQNTQLASNLPAGWYTVTVTDKNNCKVNRDIRIIDQVTAEIIAPSVCENINNDYRTSTFSVDYTSVKGGFDDPSKYTYTWDFGAGVQSITQVGDKYKVQYNTGGDKIITLNITDQANVLTTLTYLHYVGECFEGCGSSANFTIDQNNFYFGDVNGVPVNSSNCTGTTDKYLWVNITKSVNVYTITGEIEYNVNDGTQTYPRKALKCFGTLISGTPGGNGQNKPVYSQIGTGLFRLFKVQPGSMDGNSINWSCGQTFDIERINLRFTIQESKECGDNNQNQCIGLTDNIVVSTPIIASTIHENIKCNGTNTGSITINASGGVKPYKYSRNGNVASAYQDSNIFLNLPAGTYSNLWIKDIRDRTLQLPTVIISAPPVLGSAIENQVNPICFGGLGSATVKATGGTPFTTGAPFKYLWNNGVTTATANNLPAGTYTVTVIDANNCQILKEVIITQPPQLTIPNAGSDQDFNCGFTTANLNANTSTSGVGKWSIVSGNGGTISNVDIPNPVFTGLPGNQYTLRWTIANAAATCSAFDDMLINFAANCSTLDFDGVDDYVTFGNNYGFTSGAFTLEAWVKLNSLTGTKTIISKRNSSNSSNNGYELIINNGAPTFRWGNNVITSSHTLNTSRWYHVAVIHDGAKASLYVDGIFLSTGNGNNPSTNSHPFLIGAAFDLERPEIPRNYFHGWIEEVRLWKSALSEQQLRFIMNQRLTEGNASNPIRGEILPIDVPEGLNWDKLEGYYRLIGDQVTGGFTLDLASVKINGQVKNVNSKQLNTAPLPYNSLVDDQTWGTDNTWENWEVRDAPNSNGINGSPIDWNIVKTNHNIVSGAKDITVLGLISVNNELTIAAPGTQDEDNSGQFLRVSHYLKLNGGIDLVGESQLLQDEGSIVDLQSSGWLERDQQGTANSFNYNYWSSPVSSKPGNVHYTIKGVMKDGSNLLNGVPVDLNFGTAHNFADGTLDVPRKVSSYWLNLFKGDENAYAQWNKITETALIPVGEGYTMKGTANVPIANRQNYTFRGIPNNGNIKLTIKKVDMEDDYPFSSYLIGNPYPSAIDADKFIRDNLQSGNNTYNAFNGTLYYWSHFEGGNTHILKEYIGGYAVYNLGGGIRAFASDQRINATGEGGGETPGQFIPVGQSFFVNTVSASNYTSAPGTPQGDNLDQVDGGEILFKNSQRIFKKEGDHSVFHKPDFVDTKQSESVKDHTDLRKKIWLKFESPKGYHREILVTADDKASDGFDLGYDAPMIEYNIEDMFWLLGSAELVIQGIPDFNKERVIPIGLVIDKNENFTVKIEKLLNFEDKSPIYLRDKLKDSIHDLRASDFVAISEPGYINERFELIFAKDKIEIPVELPTEEPDDMMKEFGISIRHGYRERELQILNPLELDLTNMYIFDLNGNKLEEHKELPDGKEFRMPVRGYSSGVYFVQVVVEGRVVSKKIIINN